MFLIYRVLIILFVFLLGGLGVQAQEIVAPVDSLAQTDSLLVAPTDSTTLAGDSIPEKQTGLDAPVSYQATDSIVMTAGNWAYLYGEGDVKYQNIELQSELIEMNMDSSIVFAKFGLDSIGQEFGYPSFKEGDQQYESKTMRYNFGTKKGYITDVITQQGEGYVTAGRTKKMEGDILNMVGGKYTTCDDESEGAPEKEYRNGSGLSGLGGRAVVSDRTTFLFLPVLEYIFIRYYYADFRRRVYQRFLLA